MSQTLNDRYVQYSEKNSQNSPEENLQFMDMYSAQGIARGKALPQKINLFRNDNSVSSQTFERPGLGHDVDFICLRHNIKFDGTTEDARLRQQQIFEETSFLVIRLNKTEAVRVQLSKLVPYTIGNYGGNPVLQPKQELAMWKLPQTLFLGSGIPTELFLELNQDFVTDGEDNYVFAASDFGTSLVNTAAPGDPPVMKAKPNFFIGVTLEAVERSEK